MISTSSFPHITSDFAGVFCQLRELVFSKIPYKNYIIQAKTRPTPTLILPLKGRGRLLSLPLGENWREGITSPLKSEKLLVGHPGEELYSLPFRVGVGSRGVGVNVGDMINGVFRLSISLSRMACSFIRREPSRLNNAREAGQPIGSVRRAELLTDWIPACAGMTGI